MMLALWVVACQSMAVGTSPGAEEGGWNGKNSDSECGLSQCLGAQTRAQVWKEGHNKTKEGFPTQRTQLHSYETCYFKPTSNRIKTLADPRFQTFSQQSKGAEAEPTMFQGQNLPQPTGVHTRDGSFHPKGGHPAFVQLPCQARSY